MADGTLTTDTLALVRAIKGEADGRFEPAIPFWINDVALVRRERQGR